jgi:hypothetical protein
LGDFVDAANTNSRPSLGFLTVLEDPQHGLFGGYLLLNLAGRPLEFHCTAPIKPNRAQQILYGPTLEPFLYGEQIGATLLGHSNREPLAVLTDCQPVLSVRELVSVPVALVLPAVGADMPAAPPEGVCRGPAESRPAGTADQKSFRLDGAHPGGPRLLTFELGRNRLAVPEHSGDDRQLIARRLAESAEWFDFEEPFTRIREAIAEAQQAAR